MTFQAAIGLEVHVQLATRSKMFCACATGFGAPPNSLVCPVCLGLPGALPVMNAEALRLTAVTGLLFGCAVASRCRWDRKQYFYPDMPKNYQISQYDQPICAGGAVDLHPLAYPKDAQKALAAAGAPDKVVRLPRLHLEEGVAKSFHFEGASGIDFNRAGTPLLEMVTEPDMTTPEEAFAFLSVVRQTLAQAGVSGADMEKGQLRCDCNVSVRPAGQEQLGTKIEIKNLNSISGVRRALAHEIARQSAELAAGRSLRQETRGWDDAAGRTYLMRTKEVAADYRYFPDPDLPPVETAKLVAAARAGLPETPAQRRARYAADFALGAYDAAVLAGDPALAAFFEESARHAAAATPPVPAKKLANWVLNDLAADLAAGGRELADLPLRPAALVELLGLVEAGRLNGTQAKEVFAVLAAEGGSPGVIARARGLEQVSDTAAIEALCDAVIAEHPQVVADFRAGNAAALNFLKGQVMKRSKGKANPAVAGAILGRLLG